MKMSSLELENTREYHIELDDSTPPSIEPARRVPYARQEKLKQTLQKLEQQGIIASVDKPTDWVSNLVVGGEERWLTESVPRPQGTEYCNQKGAILHSNTSRRPGPVQRSNNIHSPRHEKRVLARSPVRRVVVPLHFQHAMGQETIPAHAPLV